MTSSAERLWRKWYLYRNLLVGFFVLNVFCVVSGFVLSFNYWGFKQSLRDQHRTELEKLSATADLERQVAELENLLYNGPKLERAALFREATEWQKLQSYLHASGLSNKFPFSEATVATPKSGLAYLKDIKTNLADERKKAFNKVSEMVESYSDTTREIIIIGALTLLFGLVIPGFIVWRLTRLLKRTTEQLRQTAREIADEWLRQNDKFGADGFKTVEFWVEMALLATQFTGRAANHPMAQLAGELAGLVRQEIEKSRAAKAA